MYYRLYDLPPGPSDGVHGPTNNLSAPPNDFTLVRKHESVNRTPDDLSRICGVASCGAYPSSWYCSLSFATTVGSASVVVSPRMRTSAMSRRRGRMIFERRA